MAMNPGWAERQAFVTMCGAFACVLDPSVVIAELVPLLVMTATDAVPNVRRELASVIATLRTNRAYATLPDLRDAAARLKNDVLLHLVIVQLFRLEGGGGGHLA